MVTQDAVFHQAPAARAKAASFGAMLALLAVYWTIGALIYWEATAVRELAVIGGFNLHAMDIGVALMLGAVILLMGESRFAPTTLTVTLTLFWIFMLVALIRGMTLDPVKALMSMRAVGFIALTLMAVTLMRYTDALASQLKRAILIGAFILFALTLLRHVLGPGFLMLDAPSDPMMINDGGRPLTADGTLLMGAGAVILLQRALMRWPYVDAAGPAVGALALFIGVISTSQGTAGLATGLAGLIVLVFSPGIGASQRFVLMALVLFTLAVLFWVLPTLATPEVLRDLPFAETLFGDVDQRFRNLNTRQHVWASLLREYDQRDLGNQLFGLPAGVKPILPISLWGGIYWEHSIHNMYLQTLSDYGGFGLGAYLLAMTAILFCCFRLVAGARTVEMSALGSLSLGLLATLLMIGFSYQWAYPQAAVVMLTALTAKAWAYRHVG